MFIRPARAALLLLVLAAAGACAAGGHRAAAPTAGAQCSSDGCDGRLVLRGRF